MDLDLSDPKGDHYGNGYKVWSRRLHGRENQQWLFNHKKTGGWTVKNVASHTYLGFATKQQPEHTKQLVCSVERPEYNITGNKIRARSPDPKIVIDLANGDVKDGTTILFWFENGGQNQKWLIMPLLYREQLFNNFVHSEQAMGIIMRILNVKTGLMFDGGDPNDWLYGWTWRGHTQRHDWLIKRGKTGFLIQEHQTKKYLKITEDNWLKLSVDDGTEFLLDGDEDHGFFILLADDLNRAVEPQGGSAKDGTWVQVACARRNRIAGQARGVILVDRAPPSMFRRPSSSRPRTTCDVSTGALAAENGSPTLSPGGLATGHVVAHSHSRRRAAVSSSANLPHRIPTIPLLYRLVRCCPAQRFQHDRFYACTEYSQQLFAFGIPMWVVHFEITEPVNS
ncbi:hypothetical protein RHS04_09233 [Rhizoctonia solani]|uniref:Ricin B lectin domain-containing protein n=1 Tax=Rhizoctonia solani TaxID=456999 RepID=A0A8H7LEY3_9AGAM|nr:hypothetical protein RHS04_09233 [Rhizoctonia solani]